MTKARQRERRKARGPVLSLPSRRGRLRHDGDLGEWLSECCTRMQNEIKQSYSGDIEAAIALSRASGVRETVIPEDGGEVYAYPHRLGIAWGVNSQEEEDGERLLFRGIRTPEGKDLADLG